MKLHTLLRDESGATAVEYALIMMLIALVIIGGATLLGTNVSTVLDSAAAALR